MDYEAAFGAWQNSVLDGFKDVDFEDYPGLERVAGIVVGDEATIDSCISLVEPGTDYSSPNASFYAPQPVGYFLKI